MTEQKAGWLAEQAARIGRWPRLMRIGISILFAIVLTVSVFVVLGLALDSASSITTVSWIAAGLGMVLYIIAWWALVGFDTERKTDWVPGPAAVWVVVATVAGIGVMLLSVILALIRLA